MEKLYDTLRVSNEGQPWRLDEQPAPLDFTYTFDGETRPAEAVLERTYTNAMLIVKDGKVVFERYLNNSNEDDHFLSMSMAKWITSILVGMAVDDGHIESVDDPIVEYIPELADTGYDEVTVRQALLSFGISGMRNAGHCRRRRHGAGQRGVRAGNILPMLCSLR